MRRIIQPELHVRRQSGAAPRVSARSRHGSRGTGRGGGIRPGTGGGPCGRAELAGVPSGFARSGRGTAVSAFVAFIPSGREPDKVEGRIDRASRRHFGDRKLDGRRVDDRASGDAAQIEPGQATADVTVTVCPGVKPGVCPGIVVGSAAEEERLRRHRQIDGVRAAVDGPEEGGQAGGGTKEFLIRVMHGRGVLSSLAELMGVVRAGEDTFAP